NFCYGYDSLNRLKRATDSFWQQHHPLLRPGRGRTTDTRPSGVRTTYTYDASNQVTNISHAKASPALLAFSCLYDNHGNRIQGARGQNARSVRLRRRPPPGSSARAPTHVSSRGHVLLSSRW